jgi:hypothetical protein
MKFSLRVGLGLKLVCTAARDLLPLGLAAQNVIDAGAQRDKVERRMEKTVSMPVISRSRLDSRSMTPRAIYGHDVGGKVEVPTPDYARKAHKDLLLLARDDPPHGVDEATHQRNGQDRPTDLERGGNQGCKF